MVNYIYDIRWHGGYLTAEKLTIEIIKFVIDSSLNSNIDIIIEDKSIDEADLYFRWYT